MSENKASKCSIAGCAQTKNCTKHKEIKTLNDILTNQNTELTQEEANAIQAEINHYEKRVDDCVAYKYPLPQPTAEQKQPKKTGLRAWLKEKLMQK